jgi:hypothetical protein
MHWSATLILLTATLLMAGARAWIRRGLTSSIRCVALPTKNELPWTAHYLLFQYQIAKAKNVSLLQWSQEEIALAHTLTLTDVFPFPRHFFPHFEILTGAFSTETLPSHTRPSRTIFPLASVSNLQFIRISFHNQELNLLRQLSRYHRLNEKAVTSASYLIRAMESVMDSIFDYSEIQWRENFKEAASFEWCIYNTITDTVSTQTSPGWTRQVRVTKHELRMNRNTGKWRFEKYEDLAMLLSSWELSLSSRAELIRKCSAFAHI